MNRTLKRITLEFENGTSLSLSGTEAQRWQEATDEQAAFCRTHGIQFPYLPWKVGATENQDEEPYEHTEPNFSQAFPVEKTIIVYE